MKATYKFQNGVGSANRRNDDFYYILYFIKYLEKGQIGHCKAHKLLYLLFDLFETFKQVALVNGVNSNLQTLSFINFYLEFDYCYF